MKGSQWLHRIDKTNFSVQNYIDGQFSKCLGSETIAKKCPHNGSLLYKYMAGSGEEVDSAVSSAREAFNDGRWRSITMQARRETLNKLADLIKKNSEDLALYECLDVGKPITNALTQDVPLAIETIKNCIEGADKLFCESGADGGRIAIQLRKPIGVVGCIIGWNFPLWMAAIKIAPALVMGNCVVLKPSEFSPLSAMRLAELATEAGLPPGVLNIVHGKGDIVGKSLADHLDVDMLSFTGSTDTGKRVMVSAGQSNMKRLILECGGKSPFIVFDDCSDNLDVIANNIVNLAFHNQGQWCSAGSRLLIQDGLRKTLLPKIIEQASAIVPLDPLDPTSNFGALISKGHMERVLKYIDIGISEGANLVLGGNRVQVDTTMGGNDGYFVAPTIFDNVAEDHLIANDEIFGPVLSVVTFSTEVDAIRIANGTRYGLAAYVATQSLPRSQRLSTNLNTGFLEIMGSDFPADGRVEIGVEPHRQSGFGYEIGMHGLRSYSLTTAVNFVC